MLVSMDYAIFCDFDGTITTMDTGKALLSELANGDWQYFDKLVINGTMGTREALNNQWGMLSGTKEEVDQIISTISIDPFFKDFYLWLKMQKVRFMVVSDGFRTYITRILKKNGLDPEEIEIRANDMKMKENKIELSFATEPCAHDCANCKFSYVKELKEQGYYIIYIGDGLSDILPAKELADLIFAKKDEDLARKLVGDSRVKTFSNFAEIMKELIFLEKE